MKHKLIAVLVLALVLTAAPAPAQAAGVDLVFELNFGSRQIHQASWNRLEVTVVNNGGDDLQGSVDVRAGGEYIQDVFVEAGKRSTAVFYLPPADLDSAWMGSGIVMSVRSAKGRELTSARLNVSGGGSFALGYAAVLGSSAKDFTHLGGVFLNTQLVTIEPGHLDHLPFAENFCAIVVNDPDAISLNSQQAENLRRWVEQGGVLILGGGSGWQRTANLVPDDLLPVEPRGIETISGTDLDILALPAQPSDGNYSVAVGDVRGTVLAEAGGIPLLVRKAQGQGAVLWSALDMTTAPLDNAANRIAFWERIFLLLPAADQSFNPRQPWIVNQLFNSLSQDSVASALSPLRIFLLLLAYIVLAGPVNWLVLRKLDRREWAWLTIPVLALLFTTGAFAAGRVSRGTERVLYQLNFVNVHSENLAGVHSYGGVFVPRRGRISLTAASALAPLAGGVVTETSGQTNLEFVNPPLWSVQRFFASHYVDLPGRFVLTAEAAEVKGSRLSAEVTNHSGHALFDSYIRFGDRWYSVGSLEAGEKKSFSATAEPMLNFGAVLQRYSNAGQSWYEINELLPTVPVLFVGFSEDGLVPIEGAGDTVALDIWTQTLDLGSIAFPPGELTIPKGMLTPVVAGGTADIMNRWGNEYEFSGQGSCDLVFTLPQNIDYSQGEYFLNFQSMWGDAQGSLTVYNYARSEWQELAGLDSIFKSPRSLQLESPGDLVRDDRLTVRINYDGNFALSLKGLDITVEGGSIHD